MLNRIADHLQIVASQMRDATAQAEDGIMAAKELEPNATQMEVLWQLVGQLNDSIKVSQQQVNTVLGLVGDLDHALKRVTDLGFKIHAAARTVSA